MRLEALIFDVDGTLADTERDGHRVAFNQAFTAAGLDWHWDVGLYGELLSITGGKERMCHYLAQYRPDDAIRKRKDFDALITQLHATKTDFYTQLLQTGQIPLRPGVRRLINEARTARVRLAIATTTTPANVYALLQSTLGTEAISWFEVIAAGDIVPAKKPAPDIYRYTLERMRLAPEECLVFEDSDNGLRAARGAGLSAIITINDYTQFQNFDDALLVLDHLGDEGIPATILSAKASRGEIRQVDLACLRRLHSLI